MVGPVAREQALGSDAEVRPNRPVRVRRRTPDRFQLATLGVIALGGGLGALARYGLSVWWSTPAGAFPWDTFAVNLIGCFLIGVLMVLLTEVWQAPRLLRPFAGVGVLGGFTTFSSYAVEVHVLIRTSSAALAFAYLAATLVGALAAVAVGMGTARLGGRAVRRAVRGTRGSKREVSP